MFWLRNKKEKKWYALLTEGLKFHKCANYANKIICISDHEIKGLCLNLFGTNFISLRYVLAAISLIL